MAGQKLPQYRGRLSVPEAARGIEVARENAGRLLQDAELLFASDRYPSALALAVLSIEESGKVSILRAIVLARTEEEAKSEWKEYRSHTSKNRLWPILELALKGARRLDDFASMFSGESDHPAVLDQLKQISFYTDCLGQRHWSVPSAAIEKELTSTILKTAKILSSGANVTERELELWVHHLGPAWKGRKEVMEKALVEWHAALQVEGLKPSGENHMEKFILEGVSEENQPNRALPDDDR